MIRERLFECSDKVSSLAFSSDVCELMAGEERLRTVSSADDERRAAVLISTCSRWSSLKYRQESRRLTKSCNEEKEYWRKESEWSVMAEIATLMSLKAIVDQTVFTSS